MNILLLGNGFDLAHGLPTKYTDFLEWIKAEYKLYVGASKIQKEKICVSIDWTISNCPNKFKEITVLEERKQIEIWENIHDNIWINYFLSCEMYQKENWVDFECEISNIIKSIDKDFEGKTLYEKIEDFSNDYFKNHFLYPGVESLFVDASGHRIVTREFTYFELREKLEYDLDRLIRALEIYLAEYVEKIDCKVLSPDIKEVMMQINQKSDSASYVKVISFNYTNTFERLYAKKQKIDYNYIHGRADTENELEINNMVLGIDEFLPIERRDKAIEFIAFKKFYQRIYKQTGCEYKKWIDKMKEINSRWAGKVENSPAKHNLYIFGHSLDVTDGDILRDLILTDDVHTTIFYLNKKVLGQQITNLVKVLGQDELIKRTGGSTKTIEFKQQREMEDIGKF